MSDWMHPEFENVIYQMPFVINNKFVWKTKIIMTWNQIFVKSTPF